MCIYIHIINIHSTYTYYVNKLLIWMWLIEITHFAVLVKMLSWYFSGFLLYLVHVAGLSWNERADAATKEAFNQEVNKCQIPPSDIRPIIKLYILNKWQEVWDSCTNNKLHEIHQEISNRFLISFKTRFDQVLFTRCCIGHTRPYSMHVLQDSPFCQTYFIGLSSF